MLRSELLLLPNYVLRGFAFAGVELLNLRDDFRKVVKFVDENPYSRPEKGCISWPKHVRTVEWPEIGPFLWPLIDCHVVRVFCKIQKVMQTFGANSEQIKENRHPRYLECRFW